MVSSGGVRTGTDAIERIRNGADFVQIYTPLMIEGPSAPSKILSEMQEEMKRLGVNDIN